MGCLAPTKSLFFILILVLVNFIFSALGIMLGDQAVIRIPQRIWRHAAHQHQERIRELLHPGLTSIDHPLNLAKRKEQQQHPNDSHDNHGDWVTALDPLNPVYNFLIEYYGLKGLKGPKKLRRWSPSPSLLLQNHQTTILNLEQLDELSGIFLSDDQSTTTTRASDISVLNGILLEGAGEEDFGATLHLRGAIIVEDEGVVYSPSNFFGKGDPKRREDNQRLSGPFWWYKSILEQTLESDPILHCYGLHEWAMQYRPQGAPPPPSAKYQQHLPLRVSQNVINETVERKGVSCTHVDAIRFFAEDSLPLNKFGGPLERSDQVRLEQPGCVHAHMDLLKMTLKLQPFCDAKLLQDVLTVALEARRLDVAASPYDASAYGVGVIPIDCQEGRAEYRTQQLSLMKKVEPVRRDVLRAYRTLLHLAFDDDDTVATGYNQGRLTQDKRMETSP